MSFQLSIPKNPLVHCKQLLTRAYTQFRSGWSGNIKSYKGEPMHIKVDQNKTKVDLNSLAICKEIAKIDADKLTQTEVGSIMNISIVQSHHPNDFLSNKFRIKIRSR